MAYQDTKVYYDGSHYIAIPKRPAPGHPGVRVPEDLVEVVDEEQEEIQDEPTEEQEDESDEVEEKTEEAPSEASKKPAVKRRATRRELFNELYQKLLSEPKRSRRGKLIQGMRPYFKTEEEAIEYVDKYLERKQRNLIVRRMRFSRKVNLHDFNYFCTFTYDGSLHTEETFRKRLSVCFNRFCSRKGWKYAGVWERSPKTDRLHFHGIFYIPEEAYGNIFCRGECKLHDSLKPSLFRTRRNIEVATSHVTQLIQKISSDSHMTNDLKLGKYREEQKRHVIEGVLQHYGISTRFIDIVDNHWVALWMGLNRIEKSKQINTYYHYLERYIPLAHGSLEEQDYHQYILLIAVPFSTKPITMGVSESREYVMVDLRQALPSVFLRPHAQHGLIVRKKVAPPCTPESYDMAPNVVGIIKIRIDRVKEWIGTGELLTQDNLFPSPAFDYGYDLLLKRSDLFEEEEFQIAKFV